ncbi:hypothetical protein HPB49_015935 [Dermacentor silvarum]|uniref:Uncharacterized protein n=1 Tax=Dermacentor silvarum TaxID=543639 RepID=A0ACB8CG12_DERSI|nr:hypothetical protein HPB49_015935 [Dermacentor silvarum]
MHGHASLSNLVASVLHKSMGKGSRAVVDPRLRVHGGITGLRIVDASIMPDIVTGNPNAAVYMIGEKGAAMILEDNK